MGGIFERGPREHENMFDVPPEKETDLYAENKRRIAGTVHHEGMFDEEAEGGKGEAINPVTGRPYKNKEEDEVHGLSEKNKEADGSEDALGALEEDEDEAARWLRAEEAKIATQKKGSTGEAA